MNIDVEDGDTFAHNGYAIAQIRGDMWRFAGNPHGKFAPYKNDNRSFIPMNTELAIKFLHEFLGHTINRVKPVPAIRTIPFPTHAAITREGFPYAGTAEMMGTEEIVRAWIGNSTDAYELVRLAPPGGAA